MATAAVCTALTGEDSLVIQEWPVRAPDEQEIRIAVRASSVNYPDVLVVRGLYQMRGEPPFVPGSECAGEVVEVGSAVEGFTVGDRVLSIVGQGGFSTEAIVAPVRNQVHVIPDEMPWDEAAAFNLTYGTAYHGLIRRGGLRAGESVLVNGAAGGCGSAAVQIARAVGASVIAVAGGAEKCALAKAMGADIVIDHQTTDSISAAVRAATDGRGVDVLFDNVGSVDGREEMRCLAWNGRYLIVGFAGGDIPQIKANQTILKCISIIGVAYGMSAVLDPAANREDFAQLFQWYREGSVRPHIGHRFTLEQTADAMRVLQERKALGKVVVEMPT
jgi:NADPH2:quinone reductase